MWGGRSRRAPENSRARRIRPRALRIRYRVPPMFPNDPKQKPPEQSPRPSSPRRPSGWHPPCSVPTTFPGLPEIGSRSPSQDLTGLTLLRCFLLCVRSETGRDLRHLQCFGEGRARKTKVSSARLGRVAGGHRRGFCAQGRQRIRYKTNVHTNNKVWLSVLQARRARQPHAKRQASCPSSLSKIADKAEATGFAADRMQALDVPPHRLRDASIALQ